MALSPRDRRALIILGVLAVAALGFFLLTRGGGETEEEAAPTPVAPLPPIVEPSPTPKPPRFTFFSGRDPFIPLVTQEGSGGAGTTPAQPDTGDGTGEVDEPDEGAEEGGDGGGATTEIGGHTVTLIDIFEQGGDEFAQVQVDGETFVVGEGETFADNFRLVSIQGACANFLFGDEPFTLCEGGERK